MREKHGMTNTRIYRIWQGMLKRCFNQKRECFKYYGGRGITVCDEWRDSFKAFYDWAMSSGYSDTLTLERNDVNGDYCPQNCRWATMKEQCENRKSNRFLSAFGETHTISQWAQITGLNFTTIKGRIDRLGWDAEKALFTKTRKYVDLRKEKTS